MKYKKQSGQAMIILVFVSAIVTSLVLQTSAFSLSSLSLDNEYSKGLILLNRAQGHLENAALRTLRDPSFTGEIINQDNIICTTQITDISGGKDISSSCQQNQRSRTVGLTITFSSGTYQFSPIQER